MKLIDSNTLNHIFNNNLKLEDTYYLAPDVKDESEIVEQIFNRKLPDNIKPISNEVMFDESVYLKNYEEMINKHEGRSFYNMTGFGDISILALLKTLQEYFQNQPRKLFQDMEEELIIYTEDGPLKTRIENEFNSSNNQQCKVKILGNSSL
jgi:hypothetical protein